MHVRNLSYAVRGSKKQGAPLDMSITCSGRAPSDGLSGLGGRETSGTTPWATHTATKSRDPSGMDGPSGASPGVRPAGRIGLLGRHDRTAQRFTYVACAIVSVM